MPQGHPELAQAAACPFHGFLTRALYVPGVGLRASLGIVVVTVALTGCSDGKSGDPAPGAAASDVSTQISDEEWKAVIDDWYVDGTVDEPHRCVAIREAIDQLPTRDYSAAYADLRRYERDACG